MELDDTNTWSTYKGLRKYNEVSKKNGRSDVRYLDSVKGTHIPNYADVDDGNFRHQMDYTSRDDTAPSRKKAHHTRNDCRTVGHIAGNTGQMECFSTSGRIEGSVESTSVCTPETEFDT